MILTLLLSPEEMQSYQFRSDNNWSVIGIADMRQAEPVWAEMGKAEGIGKKIISAQVILPRARGAVSVQMNVLIRNCLPDVYDYRQTIEIYKRRSLDEEEAILSREGLAIMKILAEKCSLPAGTANNFMNGFGSIFHDLYGLNAKMLGGNPLWEDNSNQ